MKQIILLGILVFTIKISAQEDCNQKVIGRIYVNATQKIVENAKVDLLDADDEFLQSQDTKLSGKFHFSLRCGESYKVVVSNPNFQSSERLINAGNIDKEIVKKNFFLNRKLKKGETRKYLYKGSVDFEYNEWKIQPRYAYELDKAAVVMQKNPKLVIHFESHTDSRAPSDFNISLSEKRIAVLKEYLGYKKIFRKRITGKAFGESKPINKCVKGVKCSDEEYLENRRTIFILKEK